MKNEFIFKSEHFWQLVELQGKKCALTSRPLTPLSTEVEMIDPNKTDNRFNIDNFYLVDSSLKFLCRHLSEKQVIELCAEVIQNRGKDFGYALRRLK